MSTARMRKIYDSRKHQWWMRWYMPIAILVGIAISIYGCWDLVLWHLHHCGNSYIIPPPEGVMEKAKMLGTIGVLTILTAPIWSLFDKLDNAKNLPGKDERTQRWVSALGIIGVAAIIITVIVSFGGPSSNNAPTAQDDNYLCALQQE